MFIIAGLSVNAQVAVKSSQDTASARLSLIKTAAYSNSLTLSVIKQKNDTLTQSLRTIINSTDSNSIYSARTVNNLATNITTLTLIKKSNDTLNTTTRFSLNTLRNIDTLGIFKTVTVSCVSTNTGTAYSTGNTITGTLTPNCFSVYVGKGQYEITTVSMYPSASNTAIAMSMSVFNATLTSGGADKSTFTTTTAFNANYAGTYQFINIVPFGGSQIYESTKPLLSAAGSNNSSFYVNPDAAGNIYFVLWANAGFTPTNGATYTIKFNLKRTN